ncbi:helix-turn-helix transcriptional regulator [Candidatus Nitronereus thalassa]|uniref:Helix-turn-helix transcriptional regulator n=1 Tax=Candidatus Nitronereus thalassa TaxID=3020898 RepID=A0ABU3KD90_9BACT|nr:helix-turn-helix transcriptional regulator [Candidatus Nitronereus thalassa]MDT7044243.1 helix-turn-helix transcriptional regulator [Candidatus Nitronereus thalassa]
MTHKVSKQQASVNTEVFLEKIVEKRAVPGVLTLTGSMCLLFMNSEAEDICHRVLQEQGNSGHESTGNGGIPKDIQDLCHALQQEIQPGGDSKEDEEIQLRRVIGEASHPILLRGFLIPGQDEHEPRFLILLEKLGRRTQVPTDEAKKHFNLTDREHDIVIQLADGRTNREIADSLNISEHTVKEHIKHILKKTQSSTRTGIMAQILKFS